MCMFLFTFNTQLKLIHFTLYCPCSLPTVPPSLPHLPHSVSLRGLPSCQEGGWRSWWVIQSRILPSHPASWYSYHIVAPWAFLPEYQHTKGDFLLSFQLWLSPASFSALISPSSLYLFCFFFHLFLAHSLLCCLSSTSSSQGWERKKDFFCLFFLVSLIVCAFLIVSEQMLSAATVVEMAAGAICRELFDLVEVTGLYSQQHAAASWTHQVVWLYFSVCCTCMQLGVTVFDFVIVHTWAACDCDRVISSKVVCGRRVCEAPALCP